VGMEPKVIFEDESLVVIDKPAGMIVNNAQSTQSDTVQDWFARTYNLQFTANKETEFAQKGGVVHRLDKDTSGVMVLVKTPEAYTKLKQQFLERKTIKKYTALIHGKLRDDSGEISKPLMRHPKDRHRFTVGGDLSRTAITEWKKVQEYKRINEDLTLLELVPHTGRTHQLRVHMQYLHHPIVSDPIYGFKKTWREDLEWCPRLFLHAAYLEFIHPVTEAKCVFEVELSEDLKLTLQNLLH
jgi:23S rRNA pseudouridine1911/1915/1917 synthase